MCSYVRQGNLKVIKMNIEKCPCVLMSSCGIRWSVVLPSNMTICRLCRDFLGEISTALSPLSTNYLKSWSLEIDYSRAPCLSADQKARGLWERDWDGNSHKWLMRMHQ